MDRTGRSRISTTKRTDPTIFVGFCHPGIVHTLWMESLLSCVPHHRLIIKGAESGPLISRSRNLLLEHFLTTQADYILMTDTDVVFDSRDLQLLLEARKPIVGALYLGIFGYDPSATYPAALTKRDGLLQSLDTIPSKLTRVDAVGMGLTLIRREVVEALHPSVEMNTPFAESVITGRHTGEDTTFCIKAKEAGYQTWLEPRARVGHIKSIVL